APTVVIVGAFTIPTVVTGRDLAAYPEGVGLGAPLPPLLGEAERLLSLGPRRLDAACAQKRLAKVLGGLALLVPALDPGPGLLEHGHGVGNSPGENVPVSQLVQERHHKELKVTGPRDRQAAFAEVAPPLGVALCVREDGEAVQRPGDAVGMLMGFGDPQTV